MTIQALKYHSLFPVHHILHWTLMKPVSISQNYPFVSPSLEPPPLRYHSPGHSWTRWPHCLCASLLAFWALQPKSGEPDNPGCLHPLLPTLPEPQCPPQRMHGSGGLGWRVYEKKQWWRVKHHVLGVQCLIMAQPGILHKWLLCYTVKGKPDLPLALVLTDAAFNYLFDLWVIHFIKAGWLYTLQKRNGKLLL